MATATKRWPTHWSYFFSTNMLSLPGLEVALWIEARGSVDTHGNITTALGTLDLNADAITTAIEKLRQHYQ
ncbi:MULTISPECIES: hypothetical protein [unclassified Pseudomonas]|uniref:hypothetical protein n=1 Tax=unclassified Pseudomonas TaxID=196821 RepID=UPI002852ECA7|nr:MULTISPECIES: hypothetical protein [unclassified Pseudomonas]